MSDALECDSTQGSATRVYKSLRSISGGRGAASLAAAAASFKCRENAWPLLVNTWQNTLSTGREKSMAAHAPTLISQPSRERTMPETALSKSWKACRNTSESLRKKGSGGGKEKGQRRGKEECGEEEGGGPHLSNRNTQPLDVPTAKTSAAAAAAAAVTMTSGLPSTSAKRSERTA